MGATRVPDSSGSAIGRLERGFGLGFARPLAWLALLLVIVLSTGLSVYIGEQARKTLMRKQQEFATFLAENLDQQILRRFTRPTIIGLRRAIDLADPEQYGVFEQVIESSMLGLDVQAIRIHNHGHTIVYSTQEDDVGKREAASRGRRRRQSC